MEKIDREIVVLAKTQLSSKNKIDKASMEIVLVRRYNSQDVKRRMHVHRHLFSVWENVHNYYKRRK